MAGTRVVVVGIVVVGVGIVVVLVRAVSEGEPVAAGRVACVVAGEGAASALVLAALETGTMAVPELQVLDRLVGVGAWEQVVERVVPQREGSRGFRPEVGTLEGVAGLGILAAFEREEEGWAAVEAEVEA